MRFPLRKLKRRCFVARRLNYFGGVGTLINYSNVLWFWHEDPTSITSRYSCFGVVSIIVQIHRPHASISPICHKALLWQSVCATPRRYF